MRQVLAFIFIALEFRIPTAHRLAANSRGTPFSNLKFDVRTKRKKYTACDEGTTKVYLDLDVVLCFGLVYDLIQL